MSTSILSPRSIKMNHEDICDAVKQAIIKKNPEMENEEFEVILSYDSYYRTVVAVAEVL